MIVVRNDVLERHPELAAALFDAFTQAKQNYLERIRSGEAPAPRTSVIASWRSGSAIRCRMASTRTRNRLQRSCATRISSG